MAIGSIPGDLLASCAIDPGADVFSGSSLNVSATLTVNAPGQSWTLTTTGAAIADSPDVIVLCSTDSQSGATFRQVVARTTASNSWTLEVLDAAGAAAAGNNLVRFALLRAAR